MSIKVSLEAFLAAYSDYIVIVGITEADIQDLDHYPISDRVLAQVLSHQTSPIPNPQSGKPMGWDGFD